MVRYIFIALLGLTFGLYAQAQTPQPPSAHGGDLTKILDRKNPENNTIVKTPEHDFSKQNPRFRALIPKSRKCVTVEMEGDLRTQHADETESDEVFEDWIDDAIKRTQATRSTRRMASTVYTLPVVVHVIYSNPTENITDEQVLSQIEVLNQDYRRQNPDQENTPKEFKKIAVDTEIEFCLASVDPEGNSTDGIDRVSISGSPFSERFINEDIKPSTIWDPERYLNIWVTNIAGGILGFAQFPTSIALTGLPSSSGAAQSDGVVINYNTFGTTGTVVPPFDKGRTVTHEVGHWLGLRHIWGDGPCGVDDFCDDTPETNSANFSCPPGTIGCSGANAMIQNFMDYTDDACMNMFTQDQKERMRAVLANSPRRTGLLNSNTCTPKATPPEPVFISDVQAGCGPLVVNFTDRSIGDPESYLWTFEGGKPSKSKKKNVQVVFKKAGTYSVSLRVANPGGSRSLQKEQLINVVKEGRQLPITAKFEPGEAFPPEGFSLYNPDRDTTWNRTEKIGGKGASNGALYIDNYDNNLKGGADWLLTPIMDFSKEKGAKLSFDLAYTNFNNNYSDTLGIFIATGCDPIYRCIYYKGGQTLANISPLQQPFLPKENEWRTEMIDLRQFDNEEFVQIAFVNFSGYGNGLFLDNIEISGTPRPAPITDFSTSLTTVCAGNSIQFSDLSTEEPTEWVWSFPGGIPASDTSQNPNVTYPKPGIYDVILTSSNKTGSGSITKEGFIVVKPAPALKLTATKTEICAGEEITLTSSGLDNFIWNLGEGVIPPLGKTITLKPEKDATYIVTGTGESGCKTEASVTVRVKPGRVLSITPSSAKICRGSTVELNATGGRNYSWFPATGLSSTNSGFIKASPEFTTTYTLIGISDDGCELKQEITIEVEEGPQDFSLIANRTSICPGEKAILKANGGASYNWFPVSSLNIAEGSEVIAAPRRTTTYRVSAQGEGGCTFSRELTIQVAPKPKIFASAGSRRICEGQALMLQASGALAYLWSPEQDLIEAESSVVEARPLQNTRYSVVGSNEFGCLDTAFVDVNVTKAEPLILTASKPSICRGDRSVLTASGAVQYAWESAPGLNSRNGQSVTVSPERDQTYRVRGTDARGCTSTGQIEVKVSRGFRPIADFRVEQSHICAGQTVQFTSLSENAVEYRWEFPGGIPSGSSEANPQVKYFEQGVHDVILNVRGCGRDTDRKVSLGSMVVTAPMNVSLNVGPDISVCRDEPFTLTARGADVYEWFPKVGLNTTRGRIVQATPQTTTTYTVTGIGDDGCKATRSVTLDVVGSGNHLNVSPFAPVICTGDNVVLEATGALSYKWTPARGLNRDIGSSVIASPEKTTQYVVEGTDIDGCVFKDTVVVTVKKRQDISVLASNSSICAGEKVTMRINGKGVYNWSPSFGLNTNTGTVVEAFPKETTNYSISGTDENGCRSETHITIKVNNIKQIAVSAQDEEICRGESTLLTATGGTTYSWSPNEGLDQLRGPIVSAAPTQTTTYTVTSGQGGCGQTQTVTVEVIEPAVLSINPANPRICNGGSVELEVNGGKVYVWDAAEGLSSIAGSVVDVFPTKTTSYGVTSLDSMGCETRGSVTVQVGNTDFISATSSVASVCRGTEVTLRASGADKYEWLAAEGILNQRLPRTVAKPEKSSVYKVVGEDKFGCKDTAEVRIDVSPVVGEFEASKMEIDLASGIGLVRFTDKTKGGAAWIWDFGQGSTSRQKNPAHVYTEVGTYNVSLRVSNGVCDDFITKKIVIKNSSSLEEITNKGEIKITKNTSDGLVNLEMESPRNMYLRLLLLDKSGTQLLSGALRISPGVYQQKLDLNGYDKGTYQLVLTDGAEILKTNIEYN